MRRLATARHRGAALLLAGLAALATSGCGDLSGGELGRAVDTLGSIAAEGELVAAGVAADRTKKTFARTRARQLSEQALHQAEKLADATPAPGLAAARDAAVARAEAISGALGALQVDPGDERRGRVAERTLRAESARVERLLGRL